MPTIPASRVVSPGVETLYPPSPHPSPFSSVACGQGRSERVGFGCRTLFVNPSGVRTEGGLAERVTSVAEGKKVEAVFTILPKVA